MCSGTFKFVSFKCMYVCVLCDIQMKVCVIQDECVIDIQSVCVWDTISCECV